MKIAFITDSIINKSTGIGNYTWYFINKFTGLNSKYDYTFIDYKRKEFHGEKYLYIKNPFKILKTYLWHSFIPIRIKKYDFDLVFNFTGVPHFTKFKQKEIFFVYDISWYLFPQFHKKGRVLFYKLLFRNTLRNSYKIIVDSNHTKNDLIKYFKISKNKIYTVYPTLNDSIEEEIKPTFLNDEKYILFVGTIEPRKNILNIIQAYLHLLKAKKTDSKLIIAGKKGWYYENVFEIVKENNLQNNVIFTGFISEQSKKYLYKHAEMLIYPSLYEGFGIPVLEAMKYGCPVITSNVSSLPEVIGNAGIIVNPHNIDEIAKAIYTVDKNKSLQKSLSLKSKLRYKKFEKSTQLEKVLSEL